MTNEPRTSPGPTTSRLPASVPLARPRLPDPGAVSEQIRAILESGALTNGSHVRRFEEAAAEYLGVRHCIAVASCTTGLLLVLKAAGLSGDVIVPSFTFMATAHSVAWNGLRPVFADVDSRTLTLSADSVAAKVGIRTSAILATHLYGAPCDVEALTEIAERSGLRLFFDAAHAFGSRHAGRMVGGFGDAEVFSLSPTKVLVAAEGGVIATDDDVLAERCRMGRDYGHPGDYDCRFIGLNARMSELHAVVAMASLSDLDERIEERNRLVDAYRSGLSAVPGITFAEPIPGDRSTYKDFTILVDPDVFGTNADGLATALAARGVETKRYYAPPVHRMQAYKTSVYGDGDLPVTDAAAARALTLPLWSGMGGELIDSLVIAVDSVASAAIYGR